MAFDIILYILAVMIFYDFSLHLIETIYGGKKKALKLNFYWSPSKIFRNNNREFYNYFWTAYWGLVFILIVIYIFTL